jgi:HAD superfamily hydrolase (TIGR01549 family)
MLAEENLIKRLQTKNLKGIIFDFDGTLLDISEPLQKAIEEIFEEYKITANPETTLQEIGALMETIQGYPLPKIVLESHDMFKYISSLESFTFLKKLQIAAKMFTRYLTYAKEAPFFSESVKVLKKLSKSYDLFIVSHNQTKNVLEHLERENISSIFKGIYGADALPSLKPDPHSLTPVFESYKSCKLDDFLMIGDMPSDIQAGKDAGVWTVAITTGVSKRDVLAEYGPHIIIDSLTELLDIIEKKNGPKSSSQKELKIKS